MIKLGLGLHSSAGLGREDFVFPLAFCGVELEHLTEGIEGRQDGRVRECKAEVVQRRGSGVAGTRGGGGCEGVQWGIALALLALAW